MHAQKDTANLSIVDVFSREFNGHYFYGLEFILDELYDETEKCLQQDDITENVDWFGLSDLTMQLD